MVPRGCLRCFSGVAVLRLCPVRHERLLFHHRFVCQRFALCSDLGFSSAMAALASATLGSLSSAFGVSVLPVQTGCLLQPSLSMATKRRAVPGARCKIWCLVGEAFKDGFPILLIAALLYAANTFARMPILCGPATDNLNLPSFSPVTMTSKVRMWGGWYRWRSYWRRGPLAHLEVQLHVLVFVGDGRGESEDATIVEELISRGAVRALATKGDLMHLLPGRSPVLACHQVRHSLW